jgi:hypothetical protein
MNVLLGPAAFSDHNTAMAWRRHLRYGFGIFGIFVGSSLCLVAWSGLRRSEAGLIPVSIGITALGFAGRLFYKSWVLRRVLTRSSWTLQVVDLELLSRPLLGNDVKVTRLWFITDQGLVCLETVAGDGTVNARSPHCRAGRRRVGAFRSRRAQAVPGPGIRPQRRDPVEHGDHRRRPGRDRQHPWIRLTSSFRSLQPPDRYSPPMPDPGVGQKRSWLNPTRRRIRDCRPTPGR